VAEPTEIRDGGKALMYKIAVSYTKEWKRLMLTLEWGTKELNVGILPRPQDWHTSIDQGNRVYAGPFFANVTTWGQAFDNEPASPAYTYRYCIACDALASWGDTEGYGRPDAAWCTCDEDVRCMETRCFV
jgi:hypothetical protein